VIRKMIDAVLIVLKELILVIEMRKMLWDEKRFYSIFQTLNVFYFLFQNLAVKFFSFNFKNYQLFSLMLYYIK